MNWHQALDLWGFERTDRDECENKMSWCTYRVSITPWSGRSWFAELSHSVNKGPSVMLAFAKGPSKDAAFKALLGEHVGTSSRATVTDLIVPSDFDLSRLT